MPKININIFCLTIIFFWQTHLSANSLKDVLVEAIDKDRSCFSYVPNIGKVTDIDNLDVKSDQFEITDEKVLILNGNVELRSINQDNDYLFGDNLIWNINESKYELTCLLYTSPSPRDTRSSRMPSSA